MTGKIYLAGAGPGDPDLLTVKAARLLAEAGAVLYDRLVSPEVLALVSPGAELHFVGKHEGEQESIQNEILLLLEECARRHPAVVRLKGGDPMVFGRGAEEWCWLVRRGWSVEVVPGISSAIAVPSLAGIPPTFRGISGGFAVVTGHRQEGGCDQWAAYAQVETLIILMGVARRAEIAQCLIRLGRDPQQPAAFIENGTTPRERVLVTTLERVAAGLTGVCNPAVMVSGEVVSQRALLLHLARSVAA